MLGKIRILKLSLISLFPDKSITKNQFRGKFMNLLPMGALRFVLAPSISVLMLVSGCNPGPAPAVYACYEGTGELPAGLETVIGDQLVNCASQGATVCNSAVDISESCLYQGQAYHDREASTVCASVPQLASFQEVIGSCQSENLHGESCTEDSDCRADHSLQCVIESSASEGVCEPVSYQAYTRLVYVYKRLPNTDLSAFSNYWQNSHAQLVESYADLLGIHGYRQLHYSNNPANLFIPDSRNALPGFDGVGEIYLDKDRFAAALQTTEGMQALNALIADKNTFADMANSSVWLARENVLRNQPRADGAVIFTWVGIGLSHLTNQEFRDYYSDQHGPLVANHADLLGISQYVQILALDDPLNDTLRTLHGTKAAYYAHAEQILDFGQSLSPETASLSSLVEADEYSFIDYSQSAMWVADEHVVIPVD